MEIPRINYENLRYVGGTIGNDTVGSVSANQAEEPTDSHRADPERSETFRGVRNSKCAGLKTKIVAAWLKCKDNALKVLLRMQGLRKPRRRRSLKFGKKGRAVGAALLSFALVVGASGTAYAMNARPVTINDDGKEVTLTSTRKDVNEILRANGTILGNDDLLDLSGWHEDTEAFIRIYRAKNVTIVDDGTETRYVCAGDVNRLFTLNNIVVGERDKVSMPGEDLLTEGLRIVINRAFDVAIWDADKETTVSFTDGTVADALEGAGLSLVGDDYVSPDREVELRPGITIRIFRVTYQVRNEQSTVPFGKVKKSDNSMYLGSTKVIQKGAEGKKESIYRDKYVNGKRTEFKLLTETMLVEPTDEIIRVGTKVVRLQAGLSPISKLKKPAAVEIGSNGVPTHYRNIITGTATAYSEDSRTSTGKRTRPGYVAVNPNQIPYGTQMWIVSSDGRYIYGYSIAADTGGFAKNGKILTDLYMDTNSMCNQWGMRNVTIYILDLPRIKL